MTFDVSASCQDLLQLLGALPSLQDMQWLQALATVLAFFVGTLWSFHVFRQERSYAPKMKVSIGLNAVFSLGGEAAAIVTVMAKNIGRRKVRPSFITTAAALRPLATDASHERAGARLDESESLSEDAASFYVFKEQDWFEPGEECTEDIVLKLPQGRIMEIRCTAQATGYTSGWSSRAILDCRSKAEREVDASQGGGQHE